MPISTSNDNLIISVVNENKIPKYGKIFECGVLKHVYLYTEVVKEEKQYIYDSCEKIHLYDSGNMSVDVAIQPNFIPKNSAITTNDNNMEYNAAIIQQITVNVSVKALNECINDAFDEFSDEAEDYLQNYFGLNFNSAAYKIEKINESPKVPEFILNATKSVQYVFYPKNTYDYIVCNDEFLTKLTYSNTRENDKQLTLTQLRYEVNQNDFNVSL